LAVADTMKPVPDHGVGHLRIVLSDTAYLGPGRADLLEGIARTGSIAAAGKAMGMSYKRAWSLVQDLNTGFGQPLVTSQRGGAAQGGAVLTDFGLLMVTTYRAMQEKAQTAVAGDVAALRAALTSKRD
jgi:molybdate transport system regulatory protein